MISNALIAVTRANIPSPPQGVWEVGPVTVRAYALCILTGIIVALWWTSKRYVRRGGDADTVIDAALIAVPAGIIGGRLYHVITDNQLYFGEGKNPWQALNITAGGLGIWGAVLLGSLAVWGVLKFKGKPLGPFADAVAPPLILAQAIGRLGNWFNQELYGGPTNVPWALEIYRRVNAAGYVDQVGGHSTGEVIATVHPTFLYELVWNVLVCIVLVLVDKRFNLTGGRLFALYVAGYTLGRFFIEQMRSDPANLIFGMRVNTLVSVVVFAAAVAFLLLRKGGTAEKPVVAAKSDTDD